MNDKYNGGEASIRARMGDGEMKGAGEAGAMGCADYLRAWRAERAALPWLLVDDHVTIEADAAVA